MTYDLRKILIHACSILAALAAVILLFNCGVYAASGTKAAAAVKSEQGACLRGSASVLSEMVTVLPDESEVVILKEVYTSRTGTSPEEIWYYVQSGGKQGYVRSDNVGKADYDTVSAYAETVLNFRAGPGMDMKILSVLDKGEKFKVYIDAEASGDKDIWYKAKVNGKYGYVCSRHTGIGKSKASSSKNSKAVKTEKKKAVPPKETSFSNVEKAIAAINKTAEGGSEPSHFIGTVKTGGVKLYSEMKTDSAAVRDLQAGSTVGIRAAYKSGSQKWYEVEITTEQAAGSTQDPVYADSDDSTDNDLEAANDEAEKSILNAGDDDDDGEDDSSDDEDDEESDDDNELITLTGYVNADQISVVITAVE